VIARPARKRSRRKSGRYREGHNAKTKMVIVNSPESLGGRWTGRSSKKILAVGKKRNIMGEGEECYRTSSRPTSRFQRQREDSKTNVIIIGSVSKTFAMTVWRIGLYTGSRRTHQAMSRCTANPPRTDSIAQYAASEAMRGSRATVPRCSPNGKRPEAHVEGLRAIPGRHLRRHGGRLRLPEFYAHLAKAKTQRRKTARAFKLLLEKAHVALVAGEAFGAPGFLSLSVCDFDRGAARKGYASGKFFSSGRLLHKL